MGQILSNPVIDKEHHSGTDSFTSFGLCAMQGWRMSMEDSHIVKLNLLKDADADHIAYYCVFDGHGGSNAAQFCGKNLASILQKQVSFRNGDLVNSLIDSFIATDECLLIDESMKNDHSGCTATSVIISKFQNQLICANSGDSRTVLASNGRAKAMSYDHKPTLTSEKSRIVAANGFVEMDRVNGNLALSRALGDFEFKSKKDLSHYEQVVTCVPDIIEHRINYDNDEFVILACDGIWDCLSSQECVDLVHYGIRQDNWSLNDISSRIVDVCCAPSTEGTGIGCDNMSIVIVALLKENETTEEWFQRIRNKNVQVNLNALNFEDKRKAIFNYFKFEEDNGHSVFDVTTKSPQNKFIQGPDTGDGMDIDDTDDDSDRHKRNQDGSIDLFSLEALLGASGIRISQDGNNTSYIHGSALSEMLASMNSANAKEHEQDNEGNEEDDTDNIEEINDN